jgi:hypothetical protein
MGSYQEEYAEMIKNTFHLCIAIYPGAVYGILIIPKDG